MRTWRSRVRLRSKTGVRGFAPVAPENGASGVLTTLQCRFHGDRSARTLLHKVQVRYFVHPVTILRLCCCFSLPLHVARLISTSTSKRLHMINDVARAGPERLPVEGHGFLCSKRLFAALDRLMWPSLFVSKRNNVNSEGGVSCAERETAQAR